MLERRIPMAVDVNARPLSRSMTGERTVLLKVRWESLRPFQFGREEAVLFLIRKWTIGSDDRLIREPRAFDGSGGFSTLERRSFGDPSQMEKIR